MKLKKIFKNIYLPKKILDLEITDISCDSRLVKKNALFFVIERNNFDIFSILKDIEKKVSAFIVSSKHKEKVSNLIKNKPIIFVDDINKEFKRIVDYFYGFNNNNFKCIAITGTNGKTTVSTLLWHILKHLGKKTSLIGTVRYCIGNKIYPATYTTPDYLFLRKIFKKIKEQKDEFVVMEASSHGIEQGRVDGIEFLRCVFTNLSRDHLDYHKTMSNYFNAKRKLFIENKKAISIINSDDFYGRKLINELKNSITYGINSEADFVGKNILLFKDKTEFDLLWQKKTFHITSALLGKYNVLNILAVIATLVSLGFPIESFISFIPTFKGVDGRIQRVADNIFVDYAHTPDALKNTLLSLREIGYEKIICVFGCGGNRDRGKRKLMGEIADKYADFSFITSDNPRDEEPLKICKEIEKGFKKNNYKIIIDRKEAIASAIKLHTVNFKCNSSVLVAGKGHEDYQIIKGKKIPFKDSDVIYKLLKN